MGIVDNHESTGIHEDSCCNLEPSSSYQWSNVSFYLCHLLRSRASKTWDQWVANSLISARFTLRPSPERQASNCFGKTQTQKYEKYKQVILKNGSLITFVHIRQAASSKQIRRSIYLRNLYSMIFRAYTMLRVSSLAVGLSMPPQCIMPPMAPCKASLGLAVA